MKDLIWDIAKSGEEALENTELQTIEEPKELFVARGVSIEAKDSTYKINKFVRRDAQVYSFNCQMEWI